MIGLEAEFTRLALTFVLVLSRVGALVASAPMLNSQSIPIRVRALMAVAMSGAVTPLCLQYEAPMFDTLAALGAAMFNEVVIGLAIGLGAMIILAGVQLTGQIVGQMSGMALAEQTDPILQANASVFGQVFYFVTSAVFVAVGGHMMLVDGLLTTFEFAPPGYAMVNDSFFEQFFGLLSLGFELGLRTAAPLMVALFLATLVLGLISRTLPQINTIVVGFGVNSLLTLGLMVTTVGSVAWAYQEPLAASIENITQAVSSSHPDAQGINSQGLELE